MSRNGSYLSADLSRVLEEYGFEENEDDNVTTGSEKDPETSGAESEEVFDGEYTLIQICKKYGPQAKCDS